MSIFEFPGSPPDLILPFEMMTLDGKPKNFAKYSVENPHPGFGKDPNILNELGHTKFPMWVFSNIENKRIIVNNEMELSQHTEKQEKPVEAPPANNSGWPS